MSRAARPDNWQDLIAGYALGDLSPEEAEHLQQILTDHPELMSEIDRLQEVLALMPYALPEHEPPAHLRDAILSTAAAERSDLPLAPTPVTDVERPVSDLPVLRRWSRWVGIAGTIAAVTVAALTADNYRLRQEVAVSRPILTALEQPNAQLYALEGTENADRAAGSLVISPTQQQVAIVAQDLPQLPAGEVYRLWAMPRNSKQPAYCGEFNTDPSGRVAIYWSAAESLCSRQPAQLLITAESASAPPVPQGELVMRSRG